MSNVFYFIKCAMGFCGHYGHQLNALAWIVSGMVAGCVLSFILKQDNA